MGLAEEVERGCSQGWIQKGFMCHGKELHSPVLCVKPEYGSAQKECTQRPGGAGNHGRSKGFSSRAAIISSYKLFFFNILQQSEIHYRINTNLQE